MKKFLKNISIAFIILFSIISLTIYFKQDGVTNKPTEFEKYWLNATEAKERVNVLIMGIDTIEGKTDADNARTDTMIICSIDPVGKTGYILSIPRDSRVKVDGRKHKTKINHAHKYGGIELAVSTVKNTFHIPIHHYIRVNYDALIKTVDDIGGVEINILQNMDYDDNASNLHIHFKPGIQTLNGQQSMEFIRYRHGYANKDLGRIEAQQYFLDSFLRKLLSAQSITKIPKYLETLYQYVDTDMSKKEIISLAATAIKINPNDIPKKTVPGNAKTINGISYYIIDEEETQNTLEYLNKGIYEKQEDITTENAPIEEPSSESKKPEYSIFVYNGCGTPKITRRVSDLLKIEELPISYSGNASNFDYEKTKIFYKDNERLAKKISGIIEVGEIKQGTGAIDYREPDIVIIVGKDFKK